jgi:EAL domain-containing protein (putative c-di-GMP-specific phosphodiesterase class I)
MSDPGPAGAAGRARSAVAALSSGGSALGQSEARLCPLPPLSGALEKLVLSLEDGGALGLVAIDASALLDIERRYGDRRLREALRANADAAEAVLRSCVGEGFVAVSDDLRQERLFFFVPRERSDRAFYGRVLPKLSDLLREQTGKVLRQVAYPYLAEADELPIGISIALHRSFRRAEGEIATVIERALAAAAFSRESSRRERSDLLERLIVEERLSTVYEPVVWLDPYRRIGFEALTRGPSGTPLESPVACFSVALACDLEYELDSVCRKLALENARCLQDGELLFLNILPSSVHDPDFSDRRLGGLLAELAISPEQIVLEVSERQSIGNYSLFREAIERFSQLGFRVAIDDIGAGYSNLEMALQLEPDYLKIDRALIHGVDEDANRQELLRGLVRLAERMGSHLIAEGIETSEELQAVRALGVACGQGYAVGRANES